MIKTIFLLLNFITVCIALEDVQIFITPDTSSIQKPAGHQLSLVCSVKGKFNERPGIIWRKHDGLEKSSKFLNIQRLDDRTMSLMINNSSSADSGVYICQVQVDGNLISKKIDVVIFEDLKFIERQTQIGEIMATASVNISCEVTSKSKRIVTYWMRHGKQILEGGKYKFYKNGSILEIKDYQPDRDAGQYTCEVSDTISSSTAIRKYTLGTKKEEKAVFCQNMCNNICSNMYNKFNSGMF